MKEKKLDYKLIPVIFMAILFYWALFNLNTVGGIIGTAISILFPFILGTFMALILNIPMMYFEKIFTKKNKKSTKGIRVISLLLSIILIILALVFIIQLVVPELVKIIKALIGNVPYYQEQIISIMNDLQVKFPDIDLDNIKNTILTSLNDFKNNFANQVPTILNSSLNMAKSIFSFITDFIIALVFAFYILLDKENLIIQTNKFMHTFFPKKAASIIKIEKLSIISFSNFVSAQVLEACILGILFIIGLLILRIPYAIPIGVLIGVTALIPIVGAFIGMFVGAILIVSVSPIKVLIFLIFFIILQQIEGNLIYPRVVGDKVGLPGMWVLFAITIGGSLMGIVGMLLAVPIGSIIHTLITEKINQNNKI